MLDQGLLLKIKTLRKKLKKENVFDEKIVPQTKTKNFTNKISWRRPCDAKKNFINPVRFMYIASRGRDLVLLLIDFPEYFDHQLHNISGAKYCSVIILLIIIRRIS